jgi:hypothetical protein
MTTICRPPLGLFYLHCNGICRYHVVFECCIYNVFVMSQGYHNWVAHITIHFFNKTHIQYKNIIFGAFCVVKGHEWMLDTYLMFIVLVVGEYLHAILNIAQPYETFKKIPMLICNIFLFLLFFNKKFQFFHTHFLCCIIWICIFFRTRCYEVIPWGSTVWVRGCRAW